MAGLIAEGLLTGTVARERLSGIKDRLAQIEAARSPGPITEKDLADPKAAWKAWTTVQRREVLRVLFERIDLAHTTKANGPRADLRRISVKWAST